MFKSLPPGLPNPLWAHGALLIYGNKVRFELDSEGINGGSARF